MIISNTENPGQIIYGPATAVDTIIFAVIKNKLSVLLIQIGQGEYQDKWAIPGGLVQLNESLDDAVKRVLSQKANIENLHLEQLYTFGNPKRDKRGHIISVSYFLLLPEPEKRVVKTLEYYSDIKWHPVNKIPEMAFDHKKIIEYAYKRLKSKMEYSNIAYSLLPEYFTLTQLQKVYEIVWNKKLDKRNFRKKILNLGIIEKTNKKEEGKAYRPANLYRFKGRELQITD